MKNTVRNFSETLKLSDSTAGSFKHHRGFTLIELLTVIAIIGILAAILIPAVGRVRSSAQSTQCVSNLRHMQIANQLYAAQNGNKYLSRSGFDEAGQFQGGWLVDKVYFELLTSISKDRGWGEWQDDLLCPTTKAMGSPQWNVLGANYGIAYEMFYEQLGLPYWGKVNSDAAIPMHKIQNPANTVAFADCTDWMLKTVEGYSYADEQANGYNSAGQLAFRHDGHAHVVNFDGSVDLYSAEDVALPKILKHFTLSTD